MLWFFLLTIGIYAAAGALALAARRSNGVALAIGTGGCVAASIVGIAASAILLLFGGSEEMRASWRVPIGELRIGVDALSAFFLLCIYLVSGLSAVYGSGYLRGHAQNRSLAPPVFFFAALAAAMTGVALARDGVLFLVAWEMMSLAGFFLVTFDDRRAEVRSAGLLYLIASHIGVVFLFILFAELARHGGSFSFASLARAGAPDRELADACFLLALVGFGTKAGFWFLHTWLPEAHPAAPSHVSATMSGVMIKMGIYGILRVLTFLGPPPLWWGIALVAVGALSGLLGILHALAQSDLKRMLAYSSVENVGVVVIGLGLGLIGQSTANLPMAFLGFGAAMLHALNHGLFKGLLFHGAGCVLHATGTRSIDELGGLFRKMPTTALTFLVASIAISGLPPLNGFVSEWLIYVAAFREGMNLAGPAAVATMAVIPTLALIGGLTAACFVRAFGLTFLGTGRTPATDAAHDPPAAMRWSMILGALLCLAIGLWPAGAFRLVERPAQLMVGGMAATDPMLAFLSPIARIALALFGLAFLLALIRRTLLQRRDVAAGSTWACGYESSTPRMQYSAASFAEPVIGSFEGMLRRKIHEKLPRGYFPRQARHELSTGDLAAEQLIAPIARQVLTAIGRLKIVQHGRVHMYLLYILVTVVVVLVWQLSGERP